MTRADGNSRVVASRARSARLAADTRFAELVVQPFELVWAGEVDDDLARPLADCRTSTLVPRAVRRLCSRAASWLVRVRPLRAALAGPAAGAALGASLANQVSDVIFGRADRPRLGLDAAAEIGLPRFIAERQ